MIGNKTQQKEDSVALRRFCRRKIEVQTQQKYHELHQSETKRHNITHSTKQTEIVGDQCVPPQFIWNLKLKTFSEEMRQAAGKAFHEPSQCRACLDKQADLALDTFIKRKRSQLQSQALQDKIQSHLYTKDSVCLLGEILEDMPRPTDDPPVIWRTMMDKERYTLH